MFLSTAAYCLLAYSPFGYQQFLKPEVLPWIPDFLAVHTALFWLAWLVTLLTLKPYIQVRLKADSTYEGSGSRKYVGSGFSRTVTTWIARAYLMAGAVAGIILAFKPLLPTIGNSFRSYVFALLSLVPPIVLAAFDHAATSMADVEVTDRRHLLRACALAGLTVAVIYALGAPFRLQRVVGVQLPPFALVEGVAASVVAHLFVFMALFLTLSAIGAVARSTRRAGATEYALQVVTAAAAVAVVAYAMVFASFAFVGVAAMAAAAIFGLAVTLAWSGAARWHAAGAPKRWSAVGLLLAPVAGRGSRGAAAVALAVLPIAAFALMDGTAKLDWNFVLQKLGALAVWIVAFALVSAVLASDLEPKKGSGGVFRDLKEKPLPTPFSTPRQLTLAAPPVIVLALFVGVDVATARRIEIIDRYAAVDISYRLIKDLRAPHDRETTDFYAYLKSHTLVHPSRVTLPKTAFTPAITKPARPPHVFLFLIDSMRRDYLSPFNPAVTFTPSIQKFADSSYPFQRAFTRYAGTSMAVPSIWAGGMLMHMFDLAPFGDRDALLHLLEAGNYRRVMGIDHIMRDLLPLDRNVDELDRGVPPMLCDFCREMRELEGKLAASNDPRPVFSYLLPQTVHIAVANRRTVPEDRPYPGFFAKVADAVREVDGCFGGFIEFLERSGMYDNSIVILTSDHGDSLGEEGRFGHAYFMVPEVMRIPLIVHLPPSLRSKVSADIDRVTFSTDITPTLYALLDNDPADLGPLFGSPLFATPGRPLPDRRRGSFLLASSYGAVYGMLTHNGRRLYAADAMDGKEERYDLAGNGPGRRLLLTAATTDLSRRLIAGELDRLAALNHFTPQP